MSRKQRLIMFGVVWGLALAIALLMHFFAGMNLWLALTITATAFLANGFLAEWEDRRPGGFLNPEEPPHESSGIKQDQGAGPVDGPAFGGFAAKPGALGVMNKETTTTQLEVCKRFNAQAEIPAPGQKVGIALQSLERLPLNAVRHVIENGTCGWYIWGGEYSDDPDFFKPLCVEHLEQHCPQLIPYLALAPGWGVVLAPDYEDIWYEAWRAQPELEADAPSMRGLS